jgi:toxin ParE1/3/4
VDGAHGDCISAGLRRGVSRLRAFPNRGAPRDDILIGLRTIGFRRRVTIAYVVEPTAVLVVGVFYGGQDFEAILREDPGAPSLE